MFFRRVAAIAAFVMSVIYCSVPASAAIITINYTYASTGNTSTAIFDATQQGATNVYDINSVIDYLVNGTSVAIPPLTLNSLDAQSGVGPGTPRLSLDGSLLDYYFGDTLGNYTYAGVGNQYGTAFGPVSGASVLYGGDGSQEPFDITSFSASAAPGAPAPLLGLGLLPALAGFAGFAATRDRRRPERLFANA